MQPPKFALLSNSLSRREASFGMSVWQYGVMGSGLPNQALGASSLADAKGNLGEVMEDR